MLHRLCRLLTGAALATGFAALGCGGDDDGGSSGGWSDGGAYDDPGYAATGGRASFAGSSGTAGAFAPGSGGSTASAPVANTNVSLGGSQDFGYFRALLDAGQVPQEGDFDAAGFFAEHHTALPAPTCGNRVCLQAMLGVMGSLLDGATNCTMLQLGLNSPIAADPGNRPPLTLAVVVDVSGSMQEAGKIDFVRQGLGLLVDGLRDEDRLALVTYSTGASVPFPMSDVFGQRAQARSLVDTLVASGGTNLYGGLERGYAEVLGNYDSGRQNRVILLSDGQPTEGITGEADILSMSKAYNSDGVGLTTIGLGTSFNANLMRNLALQADGNFYFLESAAAVSEVFTEELSYFTVPLAFDLHLDVRTGPYYAFGEARGTPFWQDTSYGGVLDVPSVFIAHRESASDVTDMGGRRGGGSALLLELMPNVTVDDGTGTSSADVATIDVQFREPGTNAIIQDSVTVNYPFAPWVTPEAGHFQADDIAVVQKSFVMLNIYVGIEIAVRAFHQNQDPTGAIIGIKRLVAAVRDYNEEIQDTDIQYDIELLERLMEVMVQNGITPPPEPTLPANPWPAD